MSYLFESCRKDLIKFILKNYQCHIYKIDDTPFNVTYDFHNEIYYRYKINGAAESVDQLMMTQKYEL
jgi:hypothetical protein